MSGSVGKNGENVTSGQIRRSVENGMCPFCGAGPFGSAFHHVARVHSFASDELFKMLDDEDRLALQSLREQQLAAARDRRAQTPASVAKLSDMVAAWRAYAGSGLAQHKIVTKLVGDYRCSHSTIQGRLGRAVGLGLIEEAELPLWIGKEYRGNIEICSQERDPALVARVQLEVSKGDTARNSNDLMVPLRSRIAVLQAGNKELARELETQRISSEKSLTTQQKLVSAMGDALEAVKKNASAEVVRAALKNGLCPFCWSGPYSVPLNHICRSHGFTKREIREMAVVTWKEPLTSEVYHEKASATAKRLSSVQNLSGKRYWDLDPSERDKRPYSAAGRALRSWHTRDDLTDMVARYRAAREAGTPKRNIAPELAAEYGVSVQAIRARLGKAVGLGMIDRSELPDWIGVYFLRSIEFHMNNRVGEVTLESGEE